MPPNAGEALSSPPQPARDPWTSRLNAQMEHLRLRFEEERLWLASRLFASRANHAAGINFHPGGARTPS
jgi:hypothetical protein